MQDLIHILPCLVMVCLVTPCRPRCPVQQPGQHTTPNDAIANAWRSQHATIDARLWIHATIPNPNTAHVVPTSFLQPPTQPTGCFPTSHQTAKTMASPFPFKRHAAAPNHDSTCRMRMPRNHCQLKRHNPIMVCCFCESRQMDAGLTFAYSLPGVVPWQPGKHLTRFAIGSFGCSLCPFSSRGGPTSRCATPASAGS